jgi:hypothetical protein
MRGGSGLEGLHHPLSGSSSPLPRLNPKYRLVKGPSLHWQCSTSLFPEMWKTLQFPTVTHLLTWPPKRHLGRTQNNHSIRISSNLNFSSTSNISHHKCHTLSPLCCSLPWKDSEGPILLLVWKSILHHAGLF